MGEGGGGARGVGFTDLWEGALGEDAVGSSAVSDSMPLGSRRAGILTLKDRFSHRHHRRQ
jgi:hypothetical protein